MILQVLRFRVGDFLDGRVKIGTPNGAPNRNHANLKNHALWLWLSVVRKVPWAATPGRDGKKDSSILCLYVGLVSSLTMFYLFLFCWDLWLGRKNTGPVLGKMNPIWRAYFFEMGWWKSNQLDDLAFFQFDDPFLREWCLKRWPEINGWNLELLRWTWAWSNPQGGVEWNPRISPWKIVDGKLLRRRLPTSSTMGTHVSFIFRGYNPYNWGLKPSFFMVLGSKGRAYHVSEAKQIAVGFQILQDFGGIYLPVEVMGKPSFVLSFPHCGKRNLHRLRPAAAVIFFIVLERPLGLFWNEGCALQRSA